MLKEYFEKLNGIASDGAVVVIKLDGLRVSTGDPKLYTLVISGGKLKDELFFHMDSENIHTLLDEGIHFYKTNS